MNENSLDSPAVSNVSRPASRLMSRLFLAGLATAAVFGCKDPPEQKAETKQQPTATEPKPAAQPEIQDSMLAVFKPGLPEAFETDDNPITDAKVELGRQLYYDERLSKNHDVSCNSCHLLDKYGVDARKTSLGHKQQPGTRNSPTVYNAAGHFRQFWDGRSPDVEDQATKPLTNPVEMAMLDDDHVVAVLESIPEYVTAFEKAFPKDAKPVSMENLGKAIGAFERKLVTPAPWDKFLAGKKKALTDEQKEGFTLFMNNGCTACHMGTLLGAQNYQKTGAVKPWPNQDDQGRYEVTKEETDKMLFKVPSLRNVAETAPYFHDGSVADLKEAIKVMGEYQLGREISDEDAAKIAAWMEALTGTIPQAYIKKPELPPSTDKTPKPDPT